MVARQALRSRDAAASILVSAHLALIDNVLDSVVILAANMVTNAVARLRNHRHNNKGSLVHAPDPIHDGLTDVEVE